MTGKKGFDNESYLAQQTEAILKRVERFDNKLYLEFGGKLATCLSQLYHNHRKGTRSGYAKFETFPIWNLPLKHPVNIAYEAATADIGDFNLADPFHLEAYGQRAIEGGYDD